MPENKTPTLIDVFQKETAIQSKKIEFLISKVPSCQMLRALRSQRFITHQKCRSVELRRKRMIKYYNILSSNMGRHLNVTTEEFKDFLISVKSSLDSLAQEIKIVFCMTSKGNFNLYNFIQDLQKEDAKFASDIKQLCEKDEKDGWFEYFLNLRNPETHTGKIIPIPYVELKMVRDIKVKPEFKKIEGEISDIPEEKVGKAPSAEKDNAIRKVGFFLPDNPKESDSSKVTCDRKIKFRNYHVDLSQRINLLFKACYREIGDEIDKMKKSISKKRCQKIRCNVRNCNLKYKSR